jgi:hypothetical protein
VRFWTSGKLLLARTSTAILGSKSRGTHGNILLSHDNIALMIGMDYCAVFCEARTNMT